MQPDHDVRIKNRLIFPIFNALVCATFGALIGFYIFLPLQSVLLGVLASFAETLGQ